MTSSWHAAQPLLALSLSSPVCGIQGVSITGDRKPPPWAALLAAAAQECDEDGAGQGTRAIFLPLQQQDCRGWMTCHKARGKGCFLFWSQSPAKHSPDLHQKSPLLLWCSNRESRAKHSVARGWATTASLQGPSLPTLAAGISPPGFSHGLSAM